MIKKTVEFVLKVPLCAYKNFRLDHTISSGVYISGGADQTTCYGKRKDDFIVFDATNPECATETTTNDTHLTLTNNLFYQRGAATSIISRRHSVKATFSCHYLLTALATVNFMTK